MTVSEGVLVAGQKALEPRSTKIVNNKSVPYATKAEAIAAIAPTRRYVGLPVNIAGVIHWFKSDITDAGLVPLEAMSFKTYIATITQTGSGAPVVVTVFKNELSGPVVWTRSGVGNYIGTLAGAFTANKTVIPQPVVANPSGANYISRAVGSINTVTVQSYAVSGGVPAAADDILYQHLVEIRVYN